MVLSVEDSDADFFFLQMALEQCPGPLEIQRAVNGEDAVNLLKTWEASADAPRPDLIILDFNLPRLNGLEVLEQIKAQSSARDIPVILFTSGVTGSIREKAMALGAQGFVTKSIDLRQMTGALAEACGKYLGRTTTSAFEE